MRLNGDLIRNRNFWKISNQEGIRQAKLTWIVRSMRNPTQDRHSHGTPKETEGQDAQETHGEEQQKWKPEELATPGKPYKE